jgi:hypothetical protein
LGRGHGGIPSVERLAGTVLRCRDDGKGVSREGLPALSAPFPGLGWRELAREAGKLLLDPAAGAGQRGGPGRPVGGDWAGVARP